MLQREWKDLERGDLVVLHDTSTGDPAALRHGSVAIVNPMGRQQVGIRLVGSDEIVWPSRLRVHRVEDMPTSCAWCRTAPSALDFEAL